MRRFLPATPVEAFRAPSFAERLKISAAVKSAILFGYWNYPFADAAACSEDDGWTSIDQAYWLYKCARPIIRAEKKADELLFSRNKSIVKLPHEFKSDTSITMGAAGDLIPVDGLESSKDIFFENIADVLFDVDVSFANLEAPVTQQNVKDTVVIERGSTPILRCSLAQFSALAGHNGKYFTALNFANNHTIDMGIEGLETTQKLFTQNGILDIGTPRDPQGYGRANTITKNGIKIGFISATYGLNGHQLPVRESYRVHTAQLMSKYVAPDLELLKKQIDDCKNRGCDFIIASIHWGYEFEFFPRVKQIEAAHTLIEEGVDLILGHHPHVIQPLEYYCTKRDPNRIAAIAYSLGGLTFGWYTAPHLVLGMILSMKLSKGLIGGVSRTYIESIKPTPVFQRIFHQDDLRLIRIEKLQEHLHGSDSYHSARYVQQMKKYADLVLGN